MRYWWVNQNQTYKNEVPDGLLWSSKTRSDGGKDKFYDNMRDFAVGDIHDAMSGELRAQERRDDRQR